MVNLELGHEGRAKAFEHRDEIMGVHPAVRGKCRRGLQDLLEHHTAVSPGILKDMPLEVLGRELVQQREETKGTNP